MTQATRAPLVLTIGGVERTLSPLKLSDLGVIVNKLGAKAITAAHASARGIKDPTMRAEILDGAYRYAAKVEVMGYDMSQYFSTFEGLVSLATLSMQVADSKVTEDDVFEILSEDKAAQAEFAKAIGSMMPQSKKGEDSDPPKEPEKTG